MSDTSARLREAAARNSELLAALAQTDHAVPSLEQHQQFVQELKDLVGQSNDKIKVLDQKREAELKDHERYRDSHMKRFMYKATGQKDKFTVKAEKEEREYFEVLQQEHQEKQVNAHLLTQIEEAEGQTRQLQADADRHKQLQFQLDDLYNDIFAGPTPSFPEEDELETKSEVALHFYHDTTEKVESESMVKQLLSKANAAMIAAQDSMQQALSYSSWDMFGGGSMSDMMERNALFQADRYVQEAVRMADLAKNHSPFVKDLPPVRLNHGNIISDVLFDNIFTDMMFHDEIQRGAQEVIRCRQQLLLQLRDAEERHRTLQQQVKARAAELEDSRKELQKARERAFASAVNGSSG